MLPNKFNKPAFAPTRESRKATMESPLKNLPQTDCIADNLLAESRATYKMLLECDRGEHRGPFVCNSPIYFTILFESYEQRESFRKAMNLMAHGEQYWEGTAFFGTLDNMQGKGNASCMKPRQNPFTARENPFAKRTKAAENAEKYSDLRAETKKVQEKLKRFTEDRTWISVCFNTEKELAEGKDRLAMPASEKFIHIEDVLSVIKSKWGIELDVPIVPFGLRALAKPDKALLELVGEY